MKKALIVGIDYYETTSQLHGCVNDSFEVKNVLERHADGSVNFGVKHLAATNAASSISRKDLKDNVRELFQDESEIALFYFAGHGHIEQTGGYLISSDSANGDDGLALSDLLAFANGSRARNKIIVLDSCHSGIVGNPDAQKKTSADLAEGLTILTASAANQYATEQDGAGVFTSLFVDALNGAASNLLGDVTPGSVYAHIDQSLGTWQQRPIFKTNVKNFVSLRRAQPPISLSDLQQIKTLFPASGHQFSLDPSYEPDPDPVPRPPGTPPPDENHTKQFKVLQKFNRLNLVVPVGAEHMYFAAMNSKGCKLTALGEHYRRLVVEGLI